MENVLPLYGNTVYMPSFSEIYIYLIWFGNIMWLCSEKRDASDKVVPDEDEEKTLIAKHIQRLQVSNFLLPTQALGIVEISIIIIVVVVV